MKNIDMIRGLSAQVSTCAELLALVMFTEMPYADRMPDHVDMDTAQKIIEEWLGEEQSGG